LREELEQAASNHPDRLKLWYTIDRPNEGTQKKINGKRRISFCNDADITGWQYSSGFVSAEMIAEKLFPPAEDTFVVLCGQYTFYLFLFYSFE
jgi:cytochrome-b5 reductase